MIKIFVKFLFGSELFSSSKFTKSLVSLSVTWSQPNTAHCASVEMALLAKPLEKIVSIIWVYWATWSDSGSWFPLSHCQLTFGGSNPEFKRNPNPQICQNSFLYRMQFNPWLWHNGKNGMQRRPSGLCRGAHYGVVWTNYRKLIHGFCINKRPIGDQEKGSRNLYNHTF